LTNVRLHPYASQRARSVVRLFFTGELVLADEAACKRFRREALALSKLSYPNIGTIFDLNSELGVDYLVIEYLAGTTLAHRLATGLLEISGNPTLQKLGS
jgi:hypothetical protein